MERTHRGTGRLWTDLPLRGKGLVVVGLPSAALFAGLLWLSSLALRENEAQNMVGHTMLVREKLDALLSDLLEVESSARGFVIAHGDDFVPSLEAARIRTEAQIKELQELVQDNPAQVGRIPLLRDWSLKKLETVDRMIDAETRQPGAASNEHLLESHRATLPLRTVVLQMEAEEARLQNLRLQRLHESRIQYAAVTAASLSLGFFGGLAGATLFGRSVARRIEILQLNARALRLEAPLLPHSEARDEIGQVEQEFQITSTLLAERSEKLRQSESQLRAIVENTTAMVYIKDLEGRLTLVNPRYAEVFGRSSAELLGEEPRDIFPPELAERIVANDQLVLRSGKAQEFEEQIMTRGKVRTCLSVKVPLFDGDGKPCGLCGISTDITERKQASDDLQQTSADLLEQVTKSAAKLAVADRQLRETTEDRT